MSQLAPRVPETLIYSKTDGVVQWQNCVETGAQVDVIEVQSSHCGLPFDPRAFEVIVDRLARRTQSEAVLLWPTPHRGVVAVSTEFGLRSLQSNIRGRWPDAR